MPLEYGDERRLTAEERDRVLDLAARLQAQHGETIAVGDLARAASEAGIDERFVLQAAARLDEQAPPSPLPWLPAGLFVLQAALMMRGNFPGNYGQRPVTLHEAAIALVVAFTLSLWAGRSPAFRWQAPVFAAACWVVVGVACSFYLNQAGYAAPWVPGVATTFGFVQTLAALASAFAARELGRARR